MVLHRRGAFRSTYFVINVRSQNLGTSREGVSALLKKRQMVWVWRGRICLAAALLVLSACGGETDPAKLATGALEALPKANFKIPENFGPPKGTATEIYTRIARGALTCWLGANGPIRKTHMFHASAEPQHKGGQSKIVIFKQRKGAAPKRGARAYVVSILPEGPSAKVGVENLRMPKKLGETMHQDVYRWAAGEVGCLKGGVVGGWAPSAGKKASKKPKKKR